MNMSRRDVLKVTGGAAMAAILPEQAIGASAATRTTTMGTIDRCAVVRRHNPIVSQLEPFSALTVGNGEFAFGADVTGLQTFPEIYEKAFPLCTAAHWAWHTTPLPPELAPEQFRFKEYETYGRRVPYATDSKGQEELFNWMRENPHRMHLGRIGLELPSREITHAKQTLDLWSGLLVST